MKRLLLLLLFLPLFVQAQVIVTVAGTGTPGYNGDGLSATATELNAPYGVALDGEDNLYICDAFNRRIRKMSPAGIITTIAGTGTAGYSGDGGPAWAADINESAYLALDKKGNVYFTDVYRIRKVTPTGIISTIAGTGTAGYNGDGIPATAAMLNLPRGVAADSIGNVYIMDRRNYRIRKVDTFGMISTVAGTGIQGFSPDGSHMDTAKLDSLVSICINKAGDLFFSDNNRIRIINFAGIITTIAGNGVIGHSGDDGPATAAMIRGGAITADTLGNLYIAESSNDRVRMVTNFGIITAIAGNGVIGYGGDGGSPLLAKLNTPQGVAVNNTGDVYIGDVGNHRIRKVTTGIIDKVESITTPKAEIEVSPNPCRGNCKLKIAYPTNVKATVVITDMAGMKVMEFEASTNESVAMPAAHLPCGVYVVTAIIGQSKLTGKLVVE